MKVTDDLIRRLFKAAASVTPLETGAPSFALETRALAAWRTSLSPADLVDLAGLRRFFRIGLGLASVITMVIIAFSLHAMAREPGDELAMPNVTVHLALSP